MWNNTEWINAFLHTLPEGHLVQALANQVAIRVQARLRSQDGAFSDIKCGSTRRENTTKGEAKTLGKSERSQGGREQQENGGRAAKGFAKLTAEAVAASFAMSAAEMVWEVAWNASSCNEKTRSQVEGCAGMCRRRGSRHRCCVHAPTACCCACCWQVLP